MLEIDDEKEDEPPDVHDDALNNIDQGSTLVNDLHVVHHPAEDGY